MDNRGRKKGETYIRYNPQYSLYFLSDFGKIHIGQFATYDKIAEYFNNNICGDIKINPSVFKNIKNNNNKNKYKNIVIEKI